MTKNKSKDQPADHDHVLFQIEVENLNLRKTKNYASVRVELSLDMEMAEEAVKAAKAARTSLPKYLRNKAREGMQTERLAAIVERIVERSETIKESQRQLNSAVADVVKLVLSDHEHFTNILMEQNAHFGAKIETLRQNQERVLDRIHRLIEVVERVDQALECCTTESVVENATTKTGVASQGCRR